MQWYTRFNDKSRMKCVLILNGIRYSPIGVVKKCKVWISIYTTSEQEHFKPEYESPRVFHIKQLFHHDFGYS